MVDQARARSFGAVAEDYDRYRPRTPAAMLDWVVLPGAEDALDLAAGTGAQTALLVRRVARVTAVEPDPAMRAVLAERVPGAELLDGTAEAIPVPDASVDLVTVSSAWHWFDRERAVPELARVLRDGGRLAVLGNGPDPRAAWVRQLRSLQRPTRDGETDPRGPRSRGDIELPPGSQFAAGEQHRETWVQPMTPAEVVGLFGTYSAAITASDEARSGLAGRVLAVLEADAETRGREVVDVPMASWAWRATRLPR